MAITDAQYKFFTVLKNCHRDDPPWKVLTWICQPINAEVVRKDKDIEPVVDYDPLNTHEYTYEIWKDGGLLFKGDYETLLEWLFKYIFNDQRGWFGELL
jgi:hypothetical protein